MIRFIFPVIMTIIVVGIVLTLHTMKKMIDVYSDWYKKHSYE
ncbi:MAG: hypothetical protein ACREHC_08950 [Candidatus Levyibacteriota bacterium]